MIVLNSKSDAYHLTDGALKSGRLVTVIPQQTTLVPVDSICTKQCNMELEPVY